MVANKKHFVNDHGFFYTGVKAPSRKYGRGKIGTTEKSRLNDRISGIKNKEKDFELCAFLRIENCTKAQLEYVESYVRMKLETIYQHVQNDHFEFEMTSKAEGYNTFVNTALEYAIEACNLQSFQYAVVHTKIFGKKMGKLERMIAAMLDR